MDPATEAHPLVVGTRQPRIELPPMKTLVVEHDWENPQVLELVGPNLVRTDLLGENKIVANWNQSPFT